MIMKNVQIVAPSDDKDDKYELMCHPGQLSKGSIRKSCYWLELSIELDTPTSPLVREFIRDS